MFIVTMMHFEYKQEATKKADLLLKAGGIFCLSIHKNQREYINLGSIQLCSKYRCMLYYYARRTYYVKCNGNSRYYT